MPLSRGSIGLNRGMAWSDKLTNHIITGSHKLSVASQLHWLHSCAAGISNSNVGCISL